VGCQSPYADVVPPRRLRLRDGAPPEQALTILRTLITEASHVTSARDASTAAHEYFNWTERAGLQLENVTTDPEVLTMLETPGFWHIREAAPKTVTQMPLWGATTRTTIETEVRRHIQTLEGLADDLQRRIRRAAGGSGAIVVLDSNILLHHQLPSKVSWEKVTGEEEVRLVIPLRVVEELDAKKWTDSARMRSRARELLPKLDECLGEGEGPGELQPGVTIEIPVDPHVPRDRPTDADREILDTCHELRQLAGRPASLLTADTNLRRRAQAEGIPVKTMPAKYRRDEPE